MKPAKFLLPGLFLFALGLGNITVGHFKSAQYEDVVSVLESTEPTPMLANVSALRRIQLAKVNADRLYVRRSTALARQDFYTLVVFGGKAFLALSFPFLLAGLLVARSHRGFTGSDRNTSNSDDAINSATGIQ